MPSVKLNAIDRLRPISSYAIISAAILLLLFIAGPSPLFSRQDVELHVESNLGASSLKSGELVARNDDPNNPSWDQRVATGRMLWCLMANPSATQSAFTWDDLGRWGWDTLDISKTQIALYQDPISGAYEEYNIEASKDSGTGILQSEDFKDKDGTIQEVSIMLLYL